MLCSNEKLYGHAYPIAIMRGSAMSETKLTEDPCSIPQVNYYSRNWLAVYFELPIQKVTTLEI